MKITTAKLPGGLVPVALACSLTALVLPAAGVVPASAATPPLADASVAAGLGTGSGLLILTQSVPPATDIPGLPPGAGIPTQQDNATPHSDGHDNHSPDNITPEMTASITARLDRIKDICSPDAVLRPYRLDCLRLALLDAARSLPPSGDYAPVRAALLKASADLDAIVQANADPAAAPLRLEIGKGLFGRRVASVRAIKVSAEARAEGAARHALDEVATALLRSATNSRRRMVAYQEIATTLESTKVLLRST